VLFNLPNAVWNVDMTTLRQHFTPAPLIGRMMATTMTVSRGSLPLIDRGLRVAEAAPSAAWARSAILG
jgi:hypothetical protein